MLRALWAEPVIILALLLEILGAGTFVYLIYKGLTA